MESLNDSFLRVKKELDALNSSIDADIGEDQKQMYIKIGKIAIDCAKKIMKPELIKSAAWKQ